MQQERQWHYAIAGQKAGPIPEIELHRLRNAGVINAQTLVWTEGWPQWRAFGQVDELQTPSFQSTSIPPLETNTPSPETDKLAMATMICGALGLTGLLCCATGPVSIAAIVLGHYTLDKSDLNEKSRQLAKVGLVLGYIGLFFMLLPLIAGLYWGGWWERLPAIMKLFQPGIGI